MKVSLKRDLQERAAHLRGRLEEEEQHKGELRKSGRQALERADSILQSVEQSLELRPIEVESGALSARQPRKMNMLTPIVRPDTAER